jgi:hypothetical protein
LTEGPECTAEDIELSEEPEDVSIEKEDTEKNTRIRTQRNTNMNKQASPGFIERHGRGECIIPCWFRIPCL